MAACLSPICDKLKERGVLCRGGIYALLIFITEFITGIILKNIRHAHGIIARPTKLQRSHSIGLCSHGFWQVSLKNIVQSEGGLKENSFDVY